MKIKKNENQQSIGNLNKEICIIFSVFLILEIILAVFFIWPEIKGVQKESSNLFSEKNLIIMQDAEIAGVDEFKKNYNSYSSNLEKISRAFIDSQNPLNFIEFLEESASNGNIELKISPLFFSKEGGANIASFQIISYGSFSDTIDFLERIEYSTNLIRVQNLTVKKSSDEERPPNEVEANFLLKILAQQ